MKNFKHQLLPFLVILPLFPESLWQPFIFDGIPTNQVEYSKESLKITVKNSASPLIYPFKKPKKVTGITVDAELIGTLPKLPNGKNQGLKETDDFVLRVGLILKGKTKLNWMQRQMAPNWLVKMEKLVPKPYGIKRVEFFTTCLDPKRVGKRQAHYMNDQLQETCLIHLKDAGSFKLQKSFNKSYEVLGLWLASDADQLKNQFEVRVNKIELHEVN